MNKTLYKRLAIIILGLMIFITFNYFIAYYFAPSTDSVKPVWMKEQYEPRNLVKDLYLDSLPWYKRLAVITFDIEGGNMDAFIPDATESPNYYQEFTKKLDTIGTCELAGENGHWEFMINAYSFLNIPVQQNYTINCGNGLKQLTISQE